ncbi:MAG: mechanosensitive ion channel family protein [Verrucomicrobiota bacterium]
MIWAPRFGYVWRISVLFLSCFVCTLASDVSDGPLAPADTSSPRGTLESFLLGTEILADALKDRREGKKSNIDIGWEVEKTLDTLDVSEIPKVILRQTSREKALKLREILDRVQLPPLEEVPGADDLELPDRWTLPGTQITIRKVAEGPRAGEYLFSPGTLDRIDRSYDRIKDLPYNDDALEGFYENLRHEPGKAWMRSLVQALPVSFQKNFFGLVVWQWIGYLVSIFFGLFLTWLLFKLGRISRRLDHDRHRFGFFLSMVFPIGAVMIPMLVKKFINEGLSIYGDLLSVTNFSLNVVAIVAMVMAVFGIGYRFIEVAASSAAKTSQGIDPLLVRLVGRLLTIVAAVVVLIEGGNSLGIPMTTLIAGAGVGGLALALGAQAAIKDMVGSMMILLDKPFEAGDRILALGFDGVVGDIGIRSTRLNLLNGHVTTIPNETVAKAEIENISRRPHIRKVMQFALALDTTAEELETALAIFRESLENHEGENEDFPPRVIVDGIGRDGIYVKVLIWYHPPAFWDYNEWLEKTTLVILKRLEEEGVRLAAPATEVSVRKETEERTSPTPQ